MVYSIGWQLPLVEVWGTDGPARPGVIAPDGCMDLFTDGERVLVAGADTRGRHFAPDSPAPLWGARFHPGLLPQVLRVPADVLCDRVVALEDVTRLVISPDQVRSSDAMQELLAKGFDPTPLEIAQQLGEGRSVAVVSQQTHWSARQLQRLAAGWFGYGPKHLSRVLRLTRAELALSRGLTRAQAAAQCGYADSAHLWRERRDLLPSRD